MSCRDSLPNWRDVRSRSSLAVLTTVALVLAVATLAHAGLGKDPDGRCGDRAFDPVVVILHLPKGNELETKVSCEQVDRGEVGYMIDRYVLLALQALKLEHGITYEIEGESRPFALGFKRVVAIDGVKNTQSNVWHHWVNGYRSKWPISGQLAADVQRIEFRYVQASGVSSRESDSTRP